MLVAADRVPHVARRFRSTVVWLHAEPLELGKTYLVKHTARQTKIRATRILHRVNVNTLARENADHLQMNEIASVEFEANVPLFFDSYSRNRTTGSFIVIEPLSNATVGAGMIEGAVDATTDAADEGLAHGAFGSAGVTVRERSKRNGHHAGVVYVGDRGEIGAKLERTLFERGFAALHVNVAPIAHLAIGDVLRVALDAGCVVILSGSAETAGVDWAALFDATTVAASEFCGDEEILAAALAFAQTLRLKPVANDPRKVN
jgi:hypothetical protein